MFDAKFFDELSRKLAEAVPENVKTLRTDMENHFRHIIQGMFAKMDLITREEFDIQIKVLSKTRAKVEQLEQALQALQRSETIEK